MSQSSNGSVGAGASASINWHAPAHGRAHAELSPAVSPSPPKLRNSCPPRCPYTRHLGGHEGSWVPKCRLSRHFGGHEFLVNPPRRWHCRGEWGGSEDARGAHAPTAMPLDPVGGLAHAHAPLPMAPPMPLSVTILQLLGTLSAVIAPGTRNNDAPPTSDSRLSSRACAF